MLGRLVVVARREVDSPVRPNIEIATSIRFEAESRPPKRNCKLGVCQRSAKQLIYLAKAKWVPNGPSQQPERKRAKGERKRPQTEQWRLTAQDQKSFISRDFSRKALAGETVSTVGSWRRERDSNIRYEPVSGMDARMVIILAQAELVSSLISVPTGRMHAGLEDDRLQLRHRLAVAARCDAAALTKGRLSIRRSPHLDVLQYTRYAA